MPVIAECSSNFAVVSGALTKRPKSVGAISSVGSGPVCLSAVGRNSGSQTSFDLLEGDLDRLAQLELVGVALDDVGGQANSRIFDDGDLCHHIRRRQVGEAEPVVDGEGRQRRLAGDVAYTHVAAAAVPAYRLRRVDQRLAVPALLDAQDAVAARGPEELVLGGEFG